MIDKDTRTMISVVVAMLFYVIAQLFGFLGFALAGAGHGSGIFGYLFFSPVIGTAGHHIYLGLVLWPAIGFLLPWSKNLIVCCLVLILLGFIYFGIFRDMAADVNEAGTTSYAVKVIKTVPDLVSLIISVFVMMQIAIFGNLIYLLISKPCNK